MGKQEFDLVMSKVDEIVGAVEKFPESAQGSACTAIISTLLYEGANYENGATRAVLSDHMANSLPPGPMAESIDRDHVAEIKRDVADFNLADVSDISLAAYATRYYTEAGPDQIRVDAITPTQLEEAFAIAGRKPPKNPLSTLHNAKNAKEPLLKSGHAKGTFVLTPIGRYHVENVLLKRDES